MKAQEPALQQEASEMLARIKARIQEEIAISRKIPVSVLLWGPSPDSESPTAKIRLLLKQKLTADGHLAQFSEELIIEDESVSVKMQELIQAQQFDIIVSLPDSPGSLAEIHDFLLDKRINHKMLVCLNEEHVKGYHYQSIMATSSALTYKMMPYPNDEYLEEISGQILVEVQKVRELKYFNQGRWIS